MDEVCKLPWREELLRPMRRRNRGPFGEQALPNWYMIWYNNQPLIWYRSKHVGLRGSKRLQIPGVPPWHPPSEPVNPALQKRSPRNQRNKANDKNVMEFHRNKFLKGHFSTFTIVLMNLKLRCSFVYLPFFRVIVWLLHGGGSNQ